MANESEMVTRSILKSELDALEARFEARLEAQDKRFEGRMDAQEERFKDFVRETVRDSETRLLQAFYGYTQTAAKHMAQLDSESSGLSSRLTTLESRVMEIERRMNFPSSN